MTEFIVLLAHKTNGVQPAQHKPATRELARKWCSSCKIELKQFKMLVGSYQAMMVCEAARFPTMAQFARSTALGDYRAEILLSFSEKDYRRVLTAMQPVRPPVKYKPHTAAAIAASASAR